MIAHKQYRKEKQDFIDTVNEHVTTMEQIKDLLQNISFDTLRVTPSASCIRTSLGEINYLFEKIRTWLVVASIICLKNFNKCNLIL